MDNDKLNLLKSQLTAANDYLTKYRTAQKPVGDVGGTQTPYIPESIKNLAPDQREVKTQYEALGDYYRPLKQYEAGPMETGIRSAQEGYGLKTAGLGVDLARQMYELEKEAGSKGTWGSTDFQKRKGLLQAGYNVDYADAFRAAQQDLYNKRNELAYQYGTSALTGLDTPITLYRVGQQGLPEVASTSAAYNPFMFGVGRREEQRRLFAPELARKAAEQANAAQMTAAQYRLLNPYTPFMQ